MLLLWLELFGVLAAVAGAGDFSHFTWWGIAVYGVGVLNGLVRQWLDVQTHTRVHQFVLATAGGVAIATLSLSGIKCHMFAEALEEMGAPQFVVGNFLVHYWPLVRALGRGPPSGLPYPYLDASRLFLVYTCLSDPAAVYDCPTTTDHSIIGGAAVFVLADLATTLCWPCVQWYLRRGVPRARW